MMKPFLLLLCATVVPALAATRTRLDDIDRLVFRSDGYAISRRSDERLPQLVCEPWTSGCDAVREVICTNTGRGGDMQWRCETELPDGLRLTRTHVSCEGWDRAGDPYVFLQSCLLEHSVDVAPRRHVAPPPPRDDVACSGGIFCHWRNDLKAFIYILLLLFVVLMIVIIVYEARRHMATSPYDGIYYVPYADRGPRIFFRDGDCGRGWCPCPYVYHYHYDIDRTYDWPRRARTVDPPRGTFYSAPPPARRRSSPTTSYASSSSRAPARDPSPKRSTSSRGSVRRHIHRPHTRPQAAAPRLLRHRIRRKTTMTNRAGGRCSGRH